MHYFSSRIIFKKELFFFYYFKSDRIKFCRREGEKFSQDRDEFCVLKLTDIKVDITAMYLPHVIDANYIVKHLFIA